MFSFPNQKLYEIQKKIEKSEVFLMLAWKDYMQAANDLSPSALNLYMYLAKNQDGYKFYFSSKDFKESFNVCDKTYRNAKLELVKKGYLKEDESSKVTFSSCGGFKESKETIRQEILKIAARLESQSQDLGDEFKVVLAEAKLTEIEDEAIWIVKAKEVLKIGMEMQEELSTKKFSDLL